MKRSGLCPKCASRELSVEKVYIRSFWSQRKMEKWTCRACGYSEFWDPDAADGTDN